MTSLHAIASYLPATRVPIASLGDHLGLTSKEIRLFERFYGLSEVCMEPDGALTDLMLAAAGKLDALRGRESDVRYVVQARTMDLVVPYPRNPVHEVGQSLGLGHAVSFTLTQHSCASGLLAVDLLGKLLARTGDPRALGLLFTGEKAFTPTAQLIPGTTIMGEGVAACLVSVDGDRDRLLGYATRTSGQYNEFVTMSAELAGDFQREYVPSLAEVVLAAIGRAGLTLSDIDVVLPHNVNRASWVRLCRLLGLPIEKVFLDNLATIGHCFCADAFINYQTLRERGGLQPGDRYLMTAVGLGATYSAMVFEH